MPMYVAMIGCWCTYRSTASFARASTCASDIGAASARRRLPLWSNRSRRDAATALVPAKMAEVLGPREFLPRENRSVDTHEFVVQGACIANPNPALHVALETRLDGDAPFPGHLHDRVHHLLGPARADRLDRFTPDALARQ